MKSSWFAPKLERSIVLAVFACGCGGHLIPSLRPAMLALTPWFLGASGLWAIWRGLPDNGKIKYLSWTLCACVLTWGIEVLGVATGIVFGAYHYGTVLGTPVLGAPPLIGFNWVVIILGCRTAVSRLPLPRIALGPLAGIMAVGFDWVLEPVALDLGYWAWADGTIPLQNYMAWWVIATVSTWAYDAAQIPAQAKSTTYLSLLQAGFFAVLRGALMFL